MANKFYYRRGGDCIYTLNLELLLREYGHEVAIFSMDYPDNLETAEDGLGDTVKPRLIEAEADLDRVPVIDEAKQELTLSDERIEKAITPVSYTHLDVYKRQHPLRRFAAIPAHPQKQYTRPGVCTIFAGFIILSGR